MKRVLLIFITTFLISIPAYAGLEVEVVDGQGSGRTAHVHSLAGSKSVHAGMLVLNERFLQFNPEFHPFLNDDFGTAMNQSVVFTGGPETITNGGDQFAWVSVDSAGAWNLTDTVNCNTGSNCVSITSANNNAFLTYTSADTVKFSGRTAVTGALRLETYDETLNSITLIFQSADSNVGVSVNLNDFVDATTLDTYQNFVIPKVAFDISTDEVDELDITVLRTGGPKPTFRFDDLQIEEIGTPVIFKATTPLGTRFHINELRIAIADAVNVSRDNVSYDQILGVASLTNGITFQRVQNGKVKFSVSINQLGDFLATGSNIVNQINDGTNTFITLLVEFPEPIILEGGVDNFLSFTINDDLSGLIQFTAAARGALEI